MRIAFLLRPSSQAGAPPGTPHVPPVTEQIITYLRDLGVQIDLVVAEGKAWDVAELAAARPEHDLYVLKTAPPLGLTLAGALTAAGAHLVNAYEPARFRDKIVTSMLLGAAGVPVPPTWAVPRARALGALVEDGPLFVKPLVGSMGEGVRRICYAYEVAELDQSAQPAAGCLPPPVIAQREVASSGRDLKVYVVGDWVAAISRPYPVIAEADRQGTPARVPPDVRDAALACGRALHLEVYGVDVVSREGRFFVVDVNSFPSFRGIPEAPRRIAEYLLAQARHPSREPASPESQQRIRAA